MQRRALVAQRGSVVIELALLLVLMLTMTAGAIQLGRIFWQYNAVNKAARDAALYVARVPQSELNSSFAAVAGFARTMVTDAAHDARVTYVGTPVFTCLPQTLCSGSIASVSVSANMDTDDTALLWFDYAGDGSSFSSVSLTPKTTMRFVGP